MRGTAIQDPRFPKLLTAKYWNIDEMSSYIVILIVMAFNNISAVII